MVSSIINAVLGSNSAEDAASAQTDANNAAIDRSGANADKTQAALEKQQAQTRADLSPFLQTGTQANNQLGYLLGLGGNDQSGGVDGAAGSLAKPFTMADYQADPGYAFRLQQGQAALDRASAAGGKYFSGAAIKGLTDYNQNSASNEYQNAYNRYNTNQTNLYNKLSGTSQSGQNAANAIGNNALGTQNSVASSNLAATNNQNQSQLNIGDANANADLAQGRAWQTGLTDTQNDLTGAGGFASGFKQGYNGAGAGFGTQGTTVQGLPWLTTNV